MDKLFTTFKLLLGKGRAFNLQGQNIQNVSKSFLKPFEDLTRIFHKIAFTPFPSENVYNNNEELTQDINNFENQFNVEPNNRATIKERAKNVEMQFGLVGGQSFEYLQHNLKNAGLDVRVVENIPPKNILSENIVQYGIIQYNANDEDEDHKQYAMYGKSGFLLMGNGILQVKEYDETQKKEIIVNKDPVAIDINNNNRNNTDKSRNNNSKNNNDNNTNNNSNNPEALSNLFLIEKAEGGIINLTAGQLDILISLILKIKPADTVALINLNII
jgi:hypothetical protein